MWVLEFGRYSRTETMVSWNWKRENKCMCLCCRNKEMHHGWYPLVQPNCSTLLEIQILLYLEKTNVKNLNPPDSTRISRILFAQYQTNPFHNCCHETLKYFEYLLSVQSCGHRSGIASSNSSHILFGQVAKFGLHVAYVWMGGWSIIVDDGGLHIQDPFMEPAPQLSVHISLSMWTAQDFISEFKGTKLYSLNSFTGNLLKINKKCRY